MLADKLSLNDPLFRCCMNQMPRVETFLDTWRKGLSSTAEVRIEEFEWLVMNVATGKHPNQFTPNFPPIALNREQVLVTLKLITAEIAKSKLQGLKVRALAYEVLASGLLQFLLYSGMEIPVAVVSKYKQYLNQAITELTGEELNVFK